MLPLMRNPAHLHVIGHARQLAVEVYRATARFPAAERFGLTAQMRRAAVSIGSNIAEGCGRSGNREFLHFLQIALGSASELEFQTQIASDLGMLNGDDAPSLDKPLGSVKGMLICLIKSRRSRDDR
jgi:four helix bundle protein